ncbi:MAG: hypothetical protein ACNA8N_15610 [Trueperaceae bacterium]
MPGDSTNETGPPRERAARSARTLRALRAWAAAALLAAAGAAAAHDWSELAPDTFEARELESALTAAEALQAGIAPEEAPPLEADAWAFEWWRWFAAAIGLDDREGADAARAALAEAGFPDDGDDPLAAWRDVVEHLVTAADAVRLQGVDMGELEAAFAGTAPAADPVRLSYLASIANEAPADAALAPYLVRFEALLAAARGSAP